MRDFPHEMLREIYEQPAALRCTLGLYLNNNSLRRDVAPRLAGWLNPRGEVLVAASGSSRHAGLAAEVMFEDLCGLAVDVEYASEYSCRRDTKRRQPSVIVISQSGETSDTLAALRSARQRGQNTLALANVAGSTILQEADFAMELGAGRELAVPATKSFTCQLCALYLLALYESEHLGAMSLGEVQERIVELHALPHQIEHQLEGWRGQMTILASKYHDATGFIYLGRGVHYAIAREGALKMKESSYLQAEGYPAGELKHGPNALVCEHVPLVVLATVDRRLKDSNLRYEKTVQLLDDLKRQGARVITVANNGDREVASLSTDCVFVEPSSEHLSPISEVIPLQLFSYSMAVERGVDVDQPRNLSKAVIEA